MSESMITIERIENNIYVIRGFRVMLDRDLAVLYGVVTKALTQAVKRNLQKFPEDFMFKLNWIEVQSLRSQNVTLEKISAKGSHSKYLPCAFTEHGATMVANVLRSERATLMSIEIVRAFTRLRHVLGITKEVDELKAFVLKHANASDREFRRVWQAIEKLSTPPYKPERRIGFSLD